MVYVVSTCTEHGTPYLAVRALDGGLQVALVKFKNRTCHPVKFRNLTCHPVEFRNITSRPIKLMNMTCRLSNLGT